MKADAMQTEAYELSQSAAKLKPTPEPINFTAPNVFPRRHGSCPHEPKI